MTRCMLGHCTRPKQYFPEFKEVIAHLLYWCGGECHGIGLVQFYFCTPGVQTTTKINEETILMPIVKPLNETLSNGQYWIF